MRNEPRKNIFIRIAIGIKRIVTILITFKKN